MEVASRAQQLLEHSLLSELHAVVARALSGLDMFAGHQLSEADLYGAEAAEAEESHADELKVNRTLILIFTYHCCMSQTVLSFTPDYHKLAYTVSRKPMHVLHLGAPSDIQT